MGTVRYFLDLTALADGRILTSGGIGLQSTEIYTG
jgi:hypothetical protein